MDIEKSDIKTTKNEGEFQVKSETFSSTWYWLQFGKSEKWDSHVSAGHGSEVAYLVNTSLLFFSTTLCGPGKNYQKATVSHPL